jgi:hypothetical protein
VENLWMIRAFPVHEATVEIFSMVRASKKEMRERCGAAFVTRFA